MSINSCPSLAGLVRASDSKAKMFTHDNSLHYVSLSTAYVRSKDERQTLIQIIASLSKSLGFPQEAALALRTYALALQYSYDRKAKSMNVRDLVNRAVTKYGEWNYH
jgi:hypothetical protein